MLKMKRERMTNTMTITRWRAASLLLVSNLLIATAGCGIISQNTTSKNCDQLAIKLLSASHSKAAENGGRYIRSLITVNNSRKLPIDRSGFTPGRDYWQIFDYYKGLIKGYSITPNGKISTVAYEGFVSQNT
jgi:hypothetical protein